MTLLALMLQPGCGGRQAMSWQGVDMIEIARKGESVELEPVAGRVTVFDFWATWCAPCKDLDRELSELARQYPDRLAIRKLEVVDADSPVVMRHLNKGTTLPHVKVFGPDGQLRFELGGKPRDIAARVESLLQSSSH